MDKSTITGVLYGALLAAFYFSGIFYIITPRISEADLLRFCMDKKIERAECVIPQPIRKATRKEQS